MSTPTRGIQHPTHPAVVGTFIGAVGATVFVLINRVNTPGAVPTVLLSTWVVALTALVHATLLRPRTLPTPGPPSPKSGAVYVVSVVAMILGMLLAARGLAALGLQELQPAAVAAIVGAHFLPFSSAFRAPVFTRLGAGLIICGVLGVVAGLAVSPWCASAAAAVGGLSMLVVMTVDARRDQT